jgi:hypothetical protein
MMEGDWGMARKLSNCRFGSVTLRLLIQQVSGLQSLCTAGREGSEPDHLCAGRVRLHLPTIERSQIILGRPTNSPLDVDRMRENRSQKGSQPSSKSAVP